MSARRPPLALAAAAHVLVYATAATMLMPFVWMLSTALKSEQEAMNGVLRLFPIVWRFDNFSQAARAAHLDRFYLNSALTATLTTVLAGAYNTLAGFAFAKMRFRGQQLLLRAVVATMMLPTTVYFLFSYLLCARLGMIDNIQSLVIPFLASGFGIVYMKQAIESVPESLLEAGRLDGMNDLDLCWTLVRPTVWPSIAALAIITFINSWNSFFWPLVAVDSDRMKTLPLAVAELAAGQYVQSWPVRMAAAVLLTVPMIVVFVCFQRAFVRGMSFSGVNE